MEIICNGIQELVDVIKDKRIVCWGIGNYFTAFLDTIEMWERELNFGYLIDNNESLQGGKKKIGGKEVEIISYEKYMHVCQKNDVIVISTVHYSAIKEQIELFQKEIPIIAYAKIKHESMGTVINRRSNSMIIPPIIHYCWFGGGDIPPQDQKYIAGWKKLCPNYKISCWNEDNFDVNQNAYTKYAYEHKKWAFVSDYVRIYALYKYGGIYLDTDVELLKNLDELRYQYAYMGMEMSGGVASGVGMGTVKSNPILKEMLARYESISLDEILQWKNWKVNAAWETEVLKEHGFKANNRYQIIENIAIYPSIFFSPVRVGDNNINVTSQTFSIHHYHYSWLSEEERKSIWKK